LLALIAQLLAAPTTMAKLGVPVPSSNANTPP
jgi:hypothetical protein